MIAFIEADNIANEYGFGNRVTLWQFGKLY
jgi:hypothetical protein